MNITSCFFVCFRPRDWETKTNKNRQFCGEKKIAGTESCGGEANALSTAWCNQLTLAGQDKESSDQPAQASQLTVVQTLNYQQLTPAGQEELNTMIQE